MAALMQIAGLPCSSKWTRFKESRALLPCLEVGQRAGQRRRKVSSLSLGKSLQSSSVGGRLSCCSSVRQLQFLHLSISVLSVDPKTGERWEMELSHLRNLQVPQRFYSLDELKLNGIIPSSLVLPVDETLGSVDRKPELAAIAGRVSMWKVFSFSPQEVFYLSVGLLFLRTLAVVKTKITPVS